MIVSVNFQGGQLVGRVLTKVCVAAALFLTGSVFSAALAGEILKLSVGKSDGEYVALIVAVFDAPEDYVYQVVTDYEHVSRINPAITEVDVQSAQDDGVVRVQHRSEHNIGPFCFGIDWGGDIVEPRRGHLRITTIPDVSSFHSGSAVWVISPQGARTWVLHESRLKPKFFIPPLIGDYYLKKHMRKEMLTTFNRIECHAKIMATTAGQATEDACVRQDLMQSGLVAQYP